jgi:L-threonylcarbamoyladenylate synthase
MILAPTETAIAEAARVLAEGGLVAFPTETVYGLGARADRAEAVRGIYAAKGRPATNPTIVHALDAEAAFALAVEVPGVARALAERHWPGPLTIVVPVRPGAVAPEATAGGPTIALRVPSHPVARALLAASGLPVAAPSANRSTHLSPTTAAHVARSLGDALRVLDGGATGFGIESTIVDVTCEPAAILRRGSIRPAILAETLAVVDRSETITKEGVVLRAPGGHARHYAPRAPLALVDADALAARVAEHLIAGQRVGVLAHGPAALELARAPHPALVLATLPAESELFERGLYAALHALDDAGVDRILVENVSTTGDFDAVRDRLRRAAHPASS